MCGRFTIMMDASILEEEFAIGKIPTDWHPRYNVTPTQPVGVVSDLVSKNIEWMRWGLIPFWAKDASIGSQMINARAETIFEKPSFRQGFLKRRCLIPADGFFEWEKPKERKSPSIPHYFTIKDTKAFFFAGLWETWRDPEGGEIRSCTIITTRANEILQPIHDRMPVIFSKENCWNWLEPANPKDLLAMLKPFPAMKMNDIIVGRGVNNPGYDNPECVLPVAG